MGPFWGAVFYENTSVQPKFSSKGAEFFWAPKILQINCAYIYKMNKCLPFELFHPNSEVFQLELFLACLETDKNYLVEVLPMEQKWEQSNVWGGHTSISVYWTLIYQDCKIFDPKGSKGD